VRKIIKILKILFSIKKKQIKFFDFTHTRGKLTKVNRIRNQPLFSAPILPLVVAQNTHQLQLQLAHVVISLVILEPHLSHRSLACLDGYTHRALRSTRSTTLEIAFSRQVSLFLLSESLLSREHPQTRWGTWLVHTTMLYRERTATSVLPLAMRCPASPRCIAVNSMKECTVSAPRSAIRDPRSVSYRGDEDKYTKRARCSSERDMRERDEGRERKRE